MASRSQRHRGSLPSPRPIGLRQDHPALVPRRPTDADSGSVTVGGIDVDPSPDRRSRPTGATCRHRLPGVQPRAQPVALENVMVPLRADGRPEQLPAQSRRATGTSGDDGARPPPPGQPLGRPATASGDRTGRALAPTLILADEPTAHLDYIQVEAILRLLRGLADDGHSSSCRHTTTACFPSPTRSSRCTRPNAECVAPNRSPRLDPGDILFARTTRRS